MCPPNRHSARRLPREADRSKEQIFGDLGQMTGPRRSRDVSTRPGVSRKGASSGHDTAAGWAGPLSEIGRPADRAVGAAGGGRGVWPVTRCQNLGCARRA